MYAMGNAPLNIRDFAIGDSIEPDLPTGGRQIGRRLIGSIRFSIGTPVLIRDDTLAVNQDYVDSRSADCASSGRLGALLRITEF